MKSNKLFRNLIFSLSLSLGLIAGNSLVFAHHGVSHSHHGYHGHHGHHGDHHGHHHGADNNTAAPIPKSTAVAPPTIVKKAPPPAPVIKDAVQVTKKSVVAKPAKDEFVITISGKDNVFEVKNKSLSISGIDLSLLPSGLKARTDLELLLVEGTGLIGVNNWIGLLSNLKSLALQDNKIKSLPKELASLKNLERINLKGNPLIGFPKVLYDLPKLTFVRLPESLKTREVFQDLMPLLDRNVLITFGDSNKRVTLADLDKL